MRRETAHRPVLINVSVTLTPFEVQALALCLTNGTIREGYAPVHAQARDRLMAAAVVEAATAFTINTPEIAEVFRRTREGLYRRL